MSRLEHLILKYTCFYTGVRDSYNKSNTKLFSLKNALKNYCASDFSFAVRLYISIVAQIFQFSDWD
jgi:hypothetical protein